MKNQEFLSAILKLTQNGQVEIRSILSTAMDPSLRSALENQLQEYDFMETEALTIALQRGWELSELNYARRFLSHRATRMRLSGRDTDSKIADIMIRKNTHAMIQGIKIFHQLPHNDPPLRILSQKLLDCENASIRQLQGYL